jgi:acyl-CoA thioester hydrolase
MQVCQEDMDEKGVASYASYLKFAEYARSEALKELGFNQVETFSQTSNFFVVKKCMVDFVHASNLDDIVVVDTLFFEVLHTSVRVDQKIKKDGRILASLETVIAFVKKLDNTTFIPARLSDEIRSSLRT